MVNLVLNELITNVHKGKSTINVHVSNTIWESTCLFSFRNDPLMLGTPLCIFQGWNDQYQKQEEGNGCNGSSQPCIRNSDWMLTCNTIPVEKCSNKIGGVLWCSIHVLHSENNIKCIEVIHKCEHCDDSNDRFDKG